MNAVYESVIKNWLPSLGGLLAGIPLLVTSSGFILTPTQQHILALIGGIGALMIGFSAKAATTHSTIAQVQASTIETNLAQVADVAKATDNVTTANAALADAKKGVTK